MLESKTREKVLKKIRRALLQKTAEPFTNLHFDSAADLPGDDPAIALARKFTGDGGKFIFCESESELNDSLRILFSFRKWRVVQADEQAARYLPAGISVWAGGEVAPDARLDLCRAVAAREASLLVTINPDQRPLACPRVAIAHASVLFSGMKEALQHINGLLSSLEPAEISALSASGGVQAGQAPEAGEIYLMYVDGK